MISRQWRGLAKAERADDYIRHLRAATFPGLEKIAGFVDASILRRKLERGVEFLVITRWASMDAIREFAGEDAETAIVPEDVRRMMLEYDSRASHYEVVE
jgi:heme-degrading monooxygenase HmoA